MSATVPVSLIDSQEANEPNKVKLSRSLRRSVATCWFVFHQLNSQQSLDY